ncbi:MAG: hypothetical protein D6806_15035 [Deltaproteobacteria bacterium]|nr:MAG: hypothetical protein D6806_15035 [Deltaproteobacteria bacterium]
MKKAVKKLVGVVLLASALGGCAYAGAAAAGGDKVVIAKNNYFLFGILREVYVCKVTDAGLAECHSSESP